MTNEPRLTRSSLAAATRSLCRRDPGLREVVRRWGPPPLWARPEGFATMLRIILEQQVSLASAGTLYARLRRELGEITPPVVAGLGETGLRALGLTRQKAAAWARLGRDVMAGLVDLRAVGRLGDVEAREKLLAIHGVGPWTAGIYLLMALRRPDVWPNGDLALAESARSIRGLPSRPTYAALERMAEAWAPWRSVAARILWHAYLSERAEGSARAARLGPA